MLFLVDPSQLMSQAQRDHVFLHDLEGNLQTGGPRPWSQVLFEAPIWNIIFPKTFRDKNLKDLIKIINLIRFDFLLSLGKMCCLIVDHRCKGGIFVDEESAPHRKKQAPELQWDEIPAHKDVQT